MSEWWTYTLTDFLLFSARTYYRLFELTNADVWPLQLVTLALGFAIAFLMLRTRASSGRAIAAILAALWLFVAWAYFLERYDAINWAARYLAIAFVVQAVLLLWTGVMRNRLIFSAREVILAIVIARESGRPSKHPSLWVDRCLLLPQRLLGAPLSRGMTTERRLDYRTLTKGIVAKVGLALFLYALAIHPLIPPLTGRPITQAEIFGLAPDPTALATLGILLAADRPPLHLVVLPFLWCLLTGLTLWTMESPEAAVAPLLGLFAVSLAIWKALAVRRKTP